jgi:hypothetical protein
MSRQHYEKLIQELCQLGNIEDAPGIINGAPMLVNDVVFSLNNSVEIDARVLLVYCDFGPVEKGREAEGYRTLLETNLLMFAANGPMYTISPTTGHVVFAHHYPVEQLDAKSLRNILAHLAAKAKDWRKTQFLDNPPLKPVNNGSNMMQRQWSNGAPGSSAT